MPVTTEPRAFLSRPSRILVFGFGMYVSLALLRGQETIPALLGAAMVFGVAHVFGVCWSRMGTALRVWYTRR